MAAAILSQDILAISLLFADGNIDLSLDEVIDRVENYQEDKDRHFGITRSDFRGLLYYWFIFDLGIKGFDENLADIKLKDITIDILGYHDAFFNDEGEYWTKDNEICYEDIDLWEIEYWFGYNKKKCQEKLIEKQQMKLFFKDHNSTTLHPDIVRKFMEEIGISDSILLHCSRPGRSS